MKLAISQPTFLPWAGYFGLLNFTDEFVFLDDVQYSKRGWQQRNCIKINNKSFNLSVPVISKNKYNQKINEVLIDNSKKFIDDHKKTIEHNYKKSKYYSSYVEEIFKIYDCKHQRLIDLNFDFIIKICELLKIKISFVKSSSLKTKSSKDGLILEICKLKQCNTYVSTIGAKDYLLNNIDEFKKFNSSSIF